MHNVRDGYRRRAISGNAAQYALMHNGTFAGSPMRNFDGHLAKSPNLLLQIRKLEEDLQAANEDKARLKHACDIMQKQCDAIVTAWKSSLSLDFGMECIFGSDMTVEQYVHMRNGQSNFFDDERQRYMRRRIEGTGE